MSACSFYIIFSSSSSSYRSIKDLAQNKISESVKVYVSVAVIFFRIVPELQVMESPVYFGKDSFAAMHSTTLALKRTLRVEVSTFLLIFGIGVGFVINVYPSRFFSSDPRRKASYRT